MNITMDEEALNQVKEKLQMAQEHLQTGCDLLTELTEEIETAGAWQGEAQTAFVAYLDLLSQYHKCFTIWNKNNPVWLAIYAFSRLLEQSETFYDEFTEYRYLKDIE